ncbi:hypothetical protein [Streptomyces sp. NPDC059787]
MLSKAGAYAGESQLDLVGMKLHTDHPVRLQQTPQPFSRLPIVRLITA